MKTKMMSYLLLFGLFLLLGGCNGKNSSPAPALQPDSPSGQSSRGELRLAAESPKLKHIRVSPLQSASFPQGEVVAPGKVEANPNRIAKVITPVAGRVLRVLVRLGDSVRGGQPLLIIDSPEAGSALTTHQQAQAQVRQAQSGVIKVDKDLVRLRELNQHGAISLKEVTAAENDLVQAQVAVEQAQAACAESRHRLDLLGLKPGLPAEVTVHAPIPGKILEISVVPGEYRNDTSASLMTIVDLSTVWVTSNVPENSIRLVELGEKIDIELAAFPGELFHGRVKRIADTVDAQTRSVRVQAELDNSAGRLRPEMFGSIHHSHPPLTLPVLPATAIIQREGGAIVFVETAAGTFKPVRVTVGEPQNGLIPVYSGLKGSERVVVDGAILLENN